MGYFIVALKVYYYSTVTSFEWIVRTGDAIFANAYKLAVS